MKFQDLTSRPEKRSCLKGIRTHAGPAELVLEWGGEGGGGGLSEGVSVRQLEESRGMLPRKNLNLSLLKWLEMHQKQSILM